MFFICFFFFFSSRRRHTRWPRDWSSDVCSSDLEITHGFVKDINEHLSIGDKVNVKILNIDEDNNKYSLSIRATMDKSAQESKKQVRKKQTKDNSSSGFNTMKEELEQWLQQSNL